jgi:shikimate kinase
MMRSIFLIGFMGSGKTLVGGELAAQLNSHFIDLDHLVETREGRSITEIFAESGEAYFRQKESLALQSLLLHGNAVIATGGGTPVFFDNMQWMNKNGLTIYLQADPEILFRRLLNERNHRPLLQAKSPEELKTFIAQKLTEREPVFRTAQFSIGVFEKSPTTIVAEIIRLLD